MNLSKNILCFKCIQCQSAYPIGDYYKGCPNCYSNKTPASLSIEYTSNESKLASLLPYPSSTLMGKGNA